MTKSSLIISIIISTAISLLISISPIKAADSSNLFPSFVFDTYGQKVSESYNPAELSIDFFSINNKIVKLTERKELYAYEDDAVRITGTAKPNSEIAVLFADNKVKAKAQKDGNWFVLFSITNLKPGEYPVTLVLNSSKQQNSVFKIVVGQGKNIFQPTYSEDTDTNPLITKNEINPQILIISVLSSLSFGWFLGFYTHNIKIKKNKSKK